VQKPIYSTVDTFSYAKKDSHQLEKNCPPAKKGDLGLIQNGRDFGIGSVLTTGTLRFWFPKMKHVRAQKQLYDQRVGRQRRIGRRFATESRFNFLAGLIPSR
jgi:hypothetical protein